MKAAFLSSVSAAAAAGLLLTGWTSTGLARRPAPVEASWGLVLVPSSPAVTSAFFALRNPGGVTDELTGATWGDGERAIVKEHVHKGTVGTWSPVPSLKIPGRSEVRMAPEATDLLIVRPPALRAGETMEFTLHFRHSRDRVVRALAVRPGGLGEDPLTTVDVWNGNPTDTADDQLSEPVPSGQ